MKKIHFVIVLSLLGFAFADQEFDRNVLIDQTKTVSMESGGLLDPSRFSVSHSYSMSYSSGSVGQSWDGLFLSTFRYKFSIPMTLSLDMGMAHQPGALFKAGPINNNEPSNSVVFPRLELRYKPFKNTMIRLQYFNSKGLGSTSPYFFGYDEFGSDDLLTTPNRRF